MVEHDLFRKPVSTFRDHTLAWLARSNGWPMVAVVPISEASPAICSQASVAERQGSRSRLAHLEVTRDPRLSHRHQPRDRSQMAAAATRRVDTPFPVEKGGSCRGTALSRVRDAGADRADRLRFPRCRLDSSSMAVWPLRSCLDDSRAHPVLTACARSAGCRLGSTRSGDETFALGLLAGELACPADRFAPLPGRSL